MSETKYHNNSTIIEGYTYIYNRVLSALADDGMVDEATRVQFAKRITDAIWELHLSVNESSHRLEKYNNFSNTKSMVSSIIRSINLNEK